MTTGTLITAAMREAVGTAVDSATAVVEPGAIVRFAQAVDDAVTLAMNPADLVAPPTFLRSLTPAVPPLPGATALAGVLDGGSRWTYARPVRPGDVITATVRLATPTERTGRLGAMLIVVYHVTYTDQLGNEVATQEMTLIRTRGTT